MRRIAMIVAVALCAATALASFAFAASGAGKAKNTVAVNHVFADCLHSPTGMLQRTYTVATLSTALHRLPADVAEYTGCADAISNAIRRSTASIASGIAMRGHPRRLLAGSVVLRDKRGRAVDTIAVSAALRAHARLAPGRYQVSAKRKSARCTPTAVTLRAFRTKKVDVVCHAAKPAKKKPARRR